MKHASKILYIFLFGLPAAVIPSSLWLTDETGLAGILAALFFFGALGLWVAIRKREAPEVTRALIGVALGVAWGMAAVMGYRSFLTETSVEIPPHTHPVRPHHH